MGAPILIFRALRGTPFLVYALSNIYEFLFEIVFFTIIITYYLVEKLIWFAIWVAVVQVAVVLTISFIPVSSLKIIFELFKTTGPCGLQEATRRPLLVALFLVDANCCKIVSLQGGHEPWKVRNAGLNLYGEAFLFWAINVFLRFTVTWFSLQRFKNKCWYY